MPYNFFCFCALIFFSAMIGSGGTFKGTENFIVDAEQFSLISADELKKIMGKEKSSEDWTNKTTHGNYKVTTKTYEKDNITYEFILFKNKVVRASIYSSNYWNGTGDRFAYSTVSEILNQFGITATKKISVEVNNGLTYRVRNISDNVFELNVQDIPKDDKTFGFAKITYDAACFD